MRNRKRILITGILRNTRNLRVQEVLELQILRGTIPSDGLLAVDQVVVVRIVEDQEAVVVTIDQVAIIRVVLVAVLE